MRKVSVVTREREELVDITAAVAEEVRAAGWENGAVLVYVPHTTAGVLVNEHADRDVARDIVAHLRRVVPRDPSFRHAEGNSDAHIKAVLTGTHVLVPVAGGALQLGRWQGIFFAEWDGPRRREVWLTFLREG
ncbi:MAG: YjbQ family protein [Brockia lithotrophica]|nr:YjbQ family protein [Brockia lithotrophica]